MTLTNMRGLKRSQSGYTLIEVIIVVGLILLGLAFAAFGFLSRSDQNRLNLAQQFFISDVPAAVISHISVHGNLNDFIALPNAAAQKAELVNRGTPPDTSWGQAWVVDSADAAANTITLTYPMGGRTPAVFAGEMVQYLTALDSSGVVPRFPHIAAAVVNGNAVDVSVRVQ